MSNSKPDEKLIYFQEGVLYSRNGTILGTVIAKEDGFYDFWPDPCRRGYWPAHMLRAIADLLDELNRPWQEQINKDPALNPPT